MSGKPTLWRQSAAVTAIALLAVVVGVSVVSVGDDTRRLVINLPLVLTALFAVWYALTREGVRRLLGGVVCVAVVAGTVAEPSTEDPEVRVAAVLRLLLLVAAAALARYALGRDVRSLVAADTPGTPVPAATRGR